MKEKLNAIRKPNQYCKKSSVLLMFVIIVLFGFTMGVISKYSDTISSNNGIYGVVIHCISEVTTQMGIWVFLASIIAMYSSKPKFAMINSLGFFLAMLFAYYLYSIFICGFYSARVILYWTVFALASTICACIVWYGKGNGWVSDIFASLPIAVLFQSGYRFYYTLSAVHVLDMIFALVLLILFSIGNKKEKGIRVLILAIVLSLIVRRFSILSILLALLDKVLQFIYM